VEMVFMCGFKYDELVQNALITVVKEVLSSVSKNGLLNNHHFYIRFRTDHPETKVPNYLRERHPEEVMIVIQYQYWNLNVSKDYFSVDLSFNGTQETLVVPFSSLTAFVDPSVKFALQFTPSFKDIDPDCPPAEEGNKDKKDTKQEKDGKIISFDSFHKK
jgi:hypothetical protein